ncbi:MAG: Phosphatidylserine decarboxylase proenzyme [Chlamydiae bacterium]|nr:Phosphatidylserine decarboxylase proenzyme [Chlamydiota bacterium]
MDIYYIDRETQKRVKEKVYGKNFLELLYKGNPLSYMLRAIVCRIPWFSVLYGWLQKRSASRKKILPFIEAYGVDTAEFFDTVESFASFNDFFIRRLKPDARPITPGDEVAILPADGRYRVIPSLKEADHIVVKGQHLKLGELFGCGELAKTYAEGALAIARLAPVDYHRFHFPFDCIPEASRLINGPLFSVNPIALRKNIDILSENKRVITPLESKVFGRVLFIEVGATNVGSIHQSFTAGKPNAKGDEKGYFSFGGSCLLLFFEPGRILFEPDLVEASAGGLEVLGKMGQPLGKR